MGRESKKTSIGGSNNTIYNSPYKELAWSWLAAGISPAQVQRSLEEKGFSVSLPVVYNFKEIMVDEAERGASLVPASPGHSAMDAIDAIPEHMRIKNDGEVLDLIIQKFSEQLRMGAADITPAVALKAIDMKKNMMGTKYKGQTVWSLMESQMQFDTLIDIMGQYLTNDQFETIMREMEKRGVISTQRPESIKEADMAIERELASEYAVEDPVRQADRF